jgi:hypothetical protein
MSNIVSAFRMKKKTQTKEQQERRFWKSLSERAVAEVSP